MIYGDGGHVIAHNGFGALMASKGLKAIAVERGKYRPFVKDKDGLNRLAKKMGKTG